MSEERTNNSALFVIMSVLGVLSITLVAGLLLMQRQENAGAFSSTVLSSRQAPTPQENFDPISWAREGAAYPPLQETEDAQKDFITDYTGTGGLPGELIPEPVKPVVIKQPAAVSTPPTQIVKPAVPKKPSYQEIREMAYFVQVFSSVNASKAEGIREELVGKGLPAVVQVKKVEGDTWYRVRIGAFEGEKEAEHYAETVREMGGYEASFVVQSPVTRRVPVNG